MYRIFNIITNKVLGLWPAHLTLKYANLCILLCCRSLYSSERWRYRGKSTLMYKYILIPTEDVIQHNMWRWHRSWQLDPQADNCPSGLLLDYLVWSFAQWCSIFQPIIIGVQGGCLLWPGDLLTDLSVLITWVKVVRRWLMTWVRDGSWSPG